MTFLKKIGLTTILLPLLSFTSIYGYDSTQQQQTSTQGLPPPPNYPAYYTPQPNQGGTVTYPAYNYPANYGYPGGYLPPAPVNPGRDDADAIYRANQHPNL